MENSDEVKLQLVVNKESSEISNENEIKATSEEELNGLFPKPYKHIPPRIDAISFQAEVSQFAIGDCSKTLDDESDLDENEDVEDNNEDDEIVLQRRHKIEGEHATLNWFDGTQMISNPNANNNTISEFLSFSRNIFASFYPNLSDHWGITDSDIPLESDEVAIQFLAKYDYNLNAARFALTSLLTSGKDAVYTDIRSSSLEKCQNLAVFNECKDKYLSKSDKLLGVFHAFHDREYEEDNTEDSRSHISPHFYSMSIFPRSLNESISIPDGNEDDKPETKDNIASEMELKARAARSGDKDKNDIRKKWNLLIEKLSILRGNLPFLASDANQLLEDAAALPPISYTPGSDASDKIKLIFGELVQDLYKSRTWLSDMRDLLYDSKHQSSLSKASKPSSSKLPMQARNISTNVSSPHVPNSIAINFIDEFLKLLDEGKLLKVQTNDFKDFENITERHSSLSKQVKLLFKKSDTKPCLSIVSSILRDIDLLPLGIVTFDDPIISPQQILEYYHTAQTLQNNTRGILKTEEVYKIRKQKYSSVTNMNGRVQFADIKTLLKDIHNCPFAIEDESLIEALFQRGSKWLNEVNLLISSPKAVSMRRVDRLINIGESLPFQFSNELSQLYDRKAQAKIWLDKMKKTFQNKIISFDQSTNGQNATVQSTIFSSRVRKSDKDTEDDKRMTIDDMRQLVEDGQLLLEDEEGIATNRAHSKELLKAQTIVSLADSWLEKVRNILHQDESDVSTMTNFLQELKSLLRQAEDMPVILDEIVVLRCQVQALEWANRVASSFNCDVSNKEDCIRIQDLQKIHREIVRIRAAVPDSILKKFPKRKMLPEEQKCHDLILQFETFMEKVKKITQGNIVKKGSSFESLFQLWKQSEALPIQLDTEIKHIRSAMITSISWVVENFETLQDLNIDLMLSNVSIFHLVLSNPLVFAGLCTGKHYFLIDDFEKIQKKTRSRLLVSHSTLHRLIQSTSSLLCDFDEVRLSHDRLIYIEAILEKANNILGYSINKSNIATITKSKSKRNDISSLSRKDVIDLLQEMTSSSSQVDLSEMIERLSEVISVGESWDKTTYEKLGAIENTKVSELMMFSQPDTHLLQRSQQDVCFNSFLIGATYSISQSIEAPSSIPSIEDNDSMDKDRFVILLNETKKLFLELKSSAIGIIPGDLTNVLEAYVALMSWLELLCQLFTTSSWSSISSSHVKSLLDSVNDSLASSFSKFMNEEFEMFKNSLEDSFNESLEFLNSIVVEAPIRGKKGRDSLNEEAYTTTGRKRAISMRAQEDNVEVSNKKVKVVDSEQVILPTFVYPDELVNTVMLIVAEVNNAIKGHCNVINDSKYHLSQDMLQLLSAFCDSLSLLQMRLKETEIWNDKLKSLMQSKNNKDMKTFEDLLNYASKRNIQSQQRHWLEKEFAKVTLWNQKTSEVICVDNDNVESHQWPTMNQLESLISDGRLLLFEATHLSKLREELRKAKLFAAKVNRFVNGDVNDENTTLTTDSLLEESKTIHVNLSEVMITMQEVNRKYCLCRGESHSDMIECDKCHDWFHFACVGLAKAHAEKLENYICIRCHIENSLIVCAEDNAKIINKWMKPEDVFKAREVYLQKIQKKMLKESKELHKLSESNNSLAEGKPITSGKIQNIDELKQQITNTKIEELTFLQSCKLEDSKIHECQGWMSVMQRIMWPQNQDELRAGKPIPFENIEETLKNSENLDDTIFNLQPEAIKRAQNAVRLLEISDVVDIKTLLANFRWIYWCILSIEMLRAPSTLKTINTVYEIGKALNHSDNKLIKSIGMISQRGKLWEAQAIKSLKPELQIAPVTIDDKLLIDLLLEANSIPFYSSLKNLLRESLKAKSTLAIPAIESDSHTNKRPRISKKYVIANSFSALLEKISNSNDIDYRNDLTPHIGYTWPVNVSVTPSKKILFSAVATNLNFPGNINSTIT